LIELLIVVSIIGIIAAAAIPNMINAINRGRQRRTMADMRSLSLAIETYAVDHDHCPWVGTTGELVPILTPTYLKKVPVTDAWNTAMVYETDSHGSVYTVISYARDLQPDATFAGGKTTDFDSDIWFQDGVFTQWPEGVQAD
jgi:general secretion pathway protein G